MNIDLQKLRLDGIYPMAEEGRLMQRIKVPAGVLSAEQALKVCELAERHAGGKLHLTTRCSIELHRVRPEDLSDLARGMAAVGLTSRGACGGAVRGIACSTGFSPNFPATQALARRIHRHFAGNPHFEGLPKKFKIAVESSYVGSRHLIQDAGLVFVGHREGENLFDLWLAGGLGREPQAAFLLERKVPESRVLPLLEAVVRLYRKHTPPGKRLKHLLRATGEATFRELLERERSAGPAALPAVSLDQGLLAEPAADAPAPVEVPVFAGDLEAALLRRLAALAREHAGGSLVLTADQNVALLPVSAAARAALLQALPGVGIDSSPEAQVNCRVCVGSHACRMGLAPTRDVTRQLVAAMTPAARKLTWAVSGCPNSCAQAQLADIGILATRSVKEENGARTPRFDLLRRHGEGLGTAVKQGLTLEDLLQEIERLP